MGEIRVNSVDERRTREGDYREEGDKRGGREEAVFFLVFLLILEV